MKNLLLYILVLFCVSCIDRQADISPLLPELQRAEELMFSDTDSALHILQQMPMPANHDRLQHATWALLMAEALYKTDVRQNDSLINIACSYFLPRDDAGRRALSLYLKGCIYDEAHREDEALPLLLQASEEIAQITDYRLGHLNEAEIGIMYERRRLFDEAYQHLNKALDYALQLGDSTYIASSYRYLARIPDLQGDYDEAVSLYKKGIEFTSANSIEKSRLYSELASVFQHIKNYHAALSQLSLALEIEKANNNKEVAEIYLVFGRIYHDIGKNDSALYYLDLAKGTSNIYASRGVYRLLRNISRETQDYERADVYADQLITVLDSIQKVERAQALLEIQNKYDEQVLINKNNLLQLRYDRIVRNALIGLLVVVIIASIIIYRYQFRIHRKEEELTLLINENNRLISMNQTQIAQLQEKINERQGIEEERDSLQRALKVMNDDHHGRNLFFTDQIVSLVSEFKNLKKTPRTLTETEISQLIQNVNLHFDSYSVRLKKMVPMLTDGDIELCSLIKLGFSIKDISVILNIDSSSVSTRRYRMQKRILESIGSFGLDKSMDDWLRAL